MSSVSNGGARLTIVRSYKAKIADVWDLWTTARGIESWWGPPGFSTTVLDLDLRAGGHLNYRMSATAPEQVAFMKKAGMPISNDHRISYSKVVPRERLEYVHLVDFVPDMEAYDVSTQVLFRTVGAMVELTLTFDPMHDEMWTKRAVMGYESELERLEQVLAKHLLA